MERKLVRIGGSTVVAIPRSIRKIAGWSVGNKVRIVAEGDVVMMVKVKESYRIKERKKRWR